LNRVQAIHRCGNGCAIAAHNWDSPSGNCFGISAEVLRGEPGTVKPLDLEGRIFVGFRPVISGNANHANEGRTDRPHEAVEGKHRSDKEYSASNAADPYADYPNTFLKSFRIAIVPLALVPQPSAHPARPGEEGLEL